MKTKSKIGLAVVVMALFVSGLFGRNADESVDIPALIKSGALIIDVRTPGEFSTGAIKGAVNIPHASIAGEIRSVTTDKSRALILYCRSGGRSAAAKRSLAQGGYTNVVNAGGLSRLRTLLGQ